MKKKLKMNQVLGSTALTAGCSMLASILGSYYNNWFIGILWGMANLLLFASIVLFLDDRNVKRIKTCRIILLGIGSITFIICAFLFIDNIKFSIFLIIIVLLVVIGLILSCSAFRLHKDIIGSEMHKGEDTCSKSTQGQIQSSQGDGGMDHNKEQ